MNAFEREAFYDREVAPALLALAEACRKAGLSLHATVEWSPGETSSTFALQPDAGPGVRHAVMAARAGSNVDNLIMGLMREGTALGHSSACLAQLGVPIKPSEGG